MKLNKDIHQLESYMRSQSWIDADENLVKIEVPGAGNMNFTLRIVTQHRSLIIKQSRAYVEKYPQVAAPADRCLREAEFYELIANDHTLSSQTPTILGLDKDHYIMLMEDLGNSNDFTDLYQTDSTITNVDLYAIIDFISKLHNSFKRENSPFVIANREMRLLNHEHIFHYPFIADNGINLDNITPGLSEIGKKYQTDGDLKSKVEKYGDTYLTDGETLLHGDYFPGSWLKTDKGIRIIDPEFCFFGYPEFEMGIVVAHLMMANQSSTTIDLAIERYESKAILNKDLCYSCAGVEIMRRILGLAQLPLTLDIQQKTDLLSQAHEFIQ